MTWYPWPISVVIAKLDALHAQIAHLTAFMEDEMKTFDEVLADIADEGTKIDSLIAMTNGLRQQLKDALAGVLTPDQQAKVDAIFDAVEANKGKVQAAIDQGTT